MFTPERSLQIVKDALGSVQQLQQIKELQVLSIRPWAMGALVASDLQPAAGVFLAGDSAHQFPPAGGFGMNTGIQVSCCVQFLYIHSVCIIYMHLFYLWSSWQGSYCACNACCRVVIVSRNC
jgi:FAD binding domain